jgi:hypothetical protein
MIDWDMVAPMIAMIVLTLTVGGVLVLRPIAKRLGALLEVMTREKLDGGQRRDLTQLRDQLDTLSQRFQLMEERQEFTERMLEHREHPEPRRLADGDD